MIETNFRPRILKGINFHKLTSEELIIERDKCFRFKNRTYQKEMESLSKVILGIKRSLDSALSNKDLLIDMQNHAIDNIELIKKNLPQVIKVEENKAKQRKERKQKRKAALTIEEEKQALLLRLAELENMGC